MRLRYLTLSLASALVLSLAACSDGSSSKAGDESDSSSSTGGNSSGGVASSSSVCESCVTADQLPTNMTLGKLYGTNLWLSAGVNGLYSLWFLDSTSTNAYGYSVIYSDFNNGTLTFDNSSGRSYDVTSSIGTAIKNGIESGITLAFSYTGDSTLQVSVNGAAPLNVETAKYLAVAGYLSKAITIVDKKLSWVSGDSNSTYFFFDKGRYVRTGHSKGDFWEAGYYDVHRQSLIILPDFYMTDGSVKSMDLFEAATTTAGYNLKESGVTRVYTESDLTVNYVDTDLLVNTWVGIENGYNWTFVLKDDASFTAIAKEGLSSTVESRTGTWGVFGDRLVFQTSSCMNTKTCSGQVYGIVSDLTEDSFSYSSTDTTDFAYPESWTVPVYE